MRNKIAHGHPSKPRSMRGGAQPHLPRSHSPVRSRRTPLSARRSGRRVHSSNSEDADRLGIAQLADCPPLFSAPVGAIFSRGDEAAFDRVS